MDKHLNTGIAHFSMKEKLLTIGMATYDDYDGVYFTIQSLRLNHPICATDQVEFVVVDNNPSGSHAEEVKKFVEGINGKYIPYDMSYGTWVKWEVPKYASGKYILVMDCHIMLQPGAIDALLDYYKENPETNNLIQGPMLSNSLNNCNTHWKREFRGNMYGIWANNNEYLKTDKPYPIDMHAMGLYSYRRETFKGINPHLKGFGGEAGYGHDLFRSWGGDCIGLPKLKWIHRFTRIDGVPFPLDIKDRIRNYFVGYLDLYKDKKHPIIKMFQREFTKSAGKKITDEVFDEAVKLVFNKPCCKENKKVILYYSSNNQPVHTEEYFQKQLLIAADGIPIVSVCRNPRTEFSKSFAYKNIVETSKSKGWETIYKQMQEGIKYILNTFGDVNVFLAEHDVLYTNSHFDITPSSNKELLENKNVYFLSESGFFKRRLGFVESQCAAKASLFKKILNQKKEDAKFKTEKGFKIAHYNSKFPALDVRTGYNYTRSRKPIQRDDYTKKLKYWGDSATLYNSIINEPKMLRTKSYLRKGKKVSFICTTYRRAHCVERIIAQYHAQDYDNKELIIFNTDTEYPIELGFEDDTIKVYNNNISYRNGKPYTNRGDILYDAIQHAEGYYFMLADDDDVYLPWHISQAVKGIEKANAEAWKPNKSLSNISRKINFSSNRLEASVIVKMDVIKDIGFHTYNAGSEGVKWHDHLRYKSKTMHVEEKDYVPSYCFNWSDPKEIKGNHQSSTIKREDNFEYHKRMCKNYAKRPMEKTFDVANFHRPYIEFLKDSDEFGSAVDDILK